MNKKEIAQKLAPLVGKPTEGKDFVNFQTHLGTMLNGGRPLPAEWIPHLVSILECSNEVGLTKRFPKIRVHRSLLSRVSVELIVIKSTGSVPESSLSDVIQVIRVLDQFGIKAELRIHPNEPVRESVGE